MWTLSGSDLIYEDQSERVPIMEVAMSTICLFHFSSPLNAKGSRNWKLLIQSNFICAASSHNRTEQNKH